MKEMTTLEAECAKIVMEGRDEKRPIIEEMEVLNTERQQLADLQDSTMSDMSSRLRELDLARIQLKVDMKAKFDEFRTKRREITRAIGELDAKLRTINHKVALRCDEARRQFLEGISTPPQPLYFGVITL